MVRKEELAYLFIGRGSSSKDTQIKRLKEELLNKETRDFNCDTVYGKELDLRGLQEKLLLLPVKSEKRLLIIRDARHLKEEPKLFLLRYLRGSRKQTILILDIDQDDPRDTFLANLKRYSRVYSSPQEEPLEAFDLVRLIERGSASASLKTLNRLLAQGLRPEFILGALRFVGQRPGWPENKRIIKSVLNCDLEIKTGRLKAAFALEKLVVSLCGFGGFHKFAR